MSKDQHLDARMDEFKAYLLTERDLARTTTDMRARIIRQWLREWDTLDPTRQDVKALKRDYILDGYDRGYIANICLAFHDYGWFIGRDLAVETPQTKKNRVPKFLSQQEVQAVLYAIERPRDRALFSLLAYTGVRVSELVSIREADLDFPSQTLTVRDGKGGKDAEVPVAEPALAEARRYLRSEDAPSDENPWLFPSPQAGHLSASRVRDLAHRYGEEAGVENVTPHRFRHALATNLLNEGCPLPFVKRVLRHERIETTMKYLGLGDKALKKNYQRFLPDY